MIVRSTLCEVFQSSAPTLIPELMIGNDNDVDKRYFLRWLEINRHRYWFTKTKHWCGGVWGCQGFEDGVVGRLGTGARNIRMIPWPAGVTLIMFLGQLDDVLGSEWMFTYTNWSSFPFCLPRHVQLHIKQQEAASGSRDHTFCLQSGRAGGHRTVRDSPCSRSWFIRSLQLMHSEPDHFVM